MVAEVGAGICSGSHRWRVIERVAGKRGSGAAVESLCAEEVIEAEARSPLVKIRDSPVSLVLRAYRE